MTTLEQRLMQALHEALGLDDWGVANDDEREEMAVLARAVVAELGLTRETRMLLGDADEERFVTDWRPLS